MYLKIVHNRAFPHNNDPNFNKFVTDCGSVYNAVIKERALEFSGEGMRRFDIIRTGILPEVAVSTRQKMKAIIDGIRNKGYYEFENGNQIPAYIWTKMVDAKAMYGYRLTTQTPEGKENDQFYFLVGEDNMMIGEV